MIGDYKKLTLHFLDLGLIFYNCCNIVLRDKVIHVLKNVLHCLFTYEKGTLQRKYLLFSFILEFLLLRLPLSASSSYICVKIGVIR